VTQWMRSFGAVSGSGEFLMLTELDDMQQAVFYQPSVFNYYRSGYVAPNTSLAAAGLVAPEFQIASESAFANWVNRAWRMSVGGIGWDGQKADVRVDIDDETALLRANGAQRFIERLNLLLFAGRMPDTLRTQFFNAIIESPSDTDSVRIAMLLSLVSAEYMVQK
jgi:hypothetical protein